MKGFYPVNRDISLYITINLKKGFYLIKTLALRKNHVCKKDLSKSSSWPFEVHAAALRGRGIRLRIGVAKPQQVPEDSPRHLGGLVTLVAVAERLQEPGWRGLSDVLRDGAFASGFGLEWGQEVVFAEIPAFMFGLRDGDLGKERRGGRRKPGDDGEEHEDRDSGQEPCGPGQQFEDEICVSFFTLKPLF